MSLSPRQFALDVIRRLQDAGFEALWAGGCVRDQLLGQEPVDYDVATNATPPRIEEIFRHRKTLALGAAFGVITVVGPRSAGNVEVATFRADGYYSDGRHPDNVTFGTAEMDAQRRDFTINGLFFDPVNEIVIDYVGGQQDIRFRLVRAIGDPARRIAEDKLRMLRAIRFSATLDFQLDPETQSTIRQRSTEIGLVSAERIFSELSRMLLHQSRGRAIELLADTGLLAQESVIPELGPVINDRVSFQRLLTRLNALDRPEFPECLAALTCDVAGTSDIATICRRLKMSKEIRDRAVWILTHADSVACADQLPWSAIQPLLTNPGILNILRFVESRDAGIRSTRNALQYCRERMTWPVDKLDPPGLIDGQSLQDAGLRPGPLFTEILRRVRQKQLDGEIQTAEQALALAKSLANNLV